MDDFSRRDTGPPLDTPAEPARRRTSEEELWTRVRQQEAAGKIGLMALTGTELPELMEQAVTLAADVLSVEFCKVLELSPDGKKLSLRAGVGWKEGYVGTATVGVNLESQAGYTLISNGPVVVEDLRTERRFEETKLLREHGIVSGVSARIQVRGHVYGVFAAHTASRRTFTEDEILFVREVADVLGAAVERKQAERDTRKVLAERTEWAAAAERRFGFLARANAALSASTDYRTVIETVVRLAVPEMSDLCFVDVVEESGGQISRVLAARPVAGEGDGVSLLRDHYPLDPSASHGTPEVLRSGRPELISEADDRDLKGVLRGARLPEGIRRPSGRLSYVCVPLRVGRNVLGALGFVSSAEKHLYDDGDLILAEGLAHSAALAMDNALHHVPEVELARELIRRSRQEPPAPERRDVPELTARQLEVLKLLSEGRSAKEIGADLYLSQATVRNHIRSLLQALGAHSQLEALATARKKGLLP